jgi:hypothetical protein
MFKSRPGRMMVVVRCVTCDMYAIERWRPKETVDQEGERNGGEVEKGVLKRFPAAGSSGATTERKQHDGIRDSTTQVESSSDQPDVNGDEEPLHPPWTILNPNGPLTFPVCPRLIGRSCTQPDSSQRPCRTTSSPPRCPVRSTNRPGNTPVSPWLPLARPLSMCVLLPYP